MSRSSQQKNTGPLDLFGEVPVTRADVYAWLLAVVNLDPASERAAGYVRGYDVINKIIRAKLDGSFEVTTEKARRGARYLELVNENPVRASAENSAAVGDWISALPTPDRQPLKRARHRPREVIRKERERERLAKAARKKVNASLLRRLPQDMPPFSFMLQDIGSPSAHSVAAAFKVDVRTAKQWMTADRAPHAVMMAIFWVTKWGISVADANAHNDAVLSASTARIRSEEVVRLKAQVAHIERLADFGSANDPLPTVKARHGASRPTSSSPTTQRKTPCKPDAAKPMRRAMR